MVKKAKTGGTKSSSPRKQAIERKADAIAALKDSSGRVTPKALVIAARDPSHECHEDFDWNDTTAAQRDRERTAAELIRQVRFIVEYEDRKIVVPFYVSDPREKSSSYVASSRVAKNVALSERVLRDELDRITSAIRRAMGLAATFNLTSSFERMLDQAMEIETRLAGIDDGDEARA